MEAPKVLSLSVARVDVLHEPINPAGIVKWPVIQAAAEMMRGRVDPDCNHDVTEIARGIAAFERGGNCELIVSVSSAVNFTTSSHFECRTSLIA
jgi:hypothetical protein